MAEVWQLPEGNWCIADGGDIVELTEREALEVYDALRKALKGIQGEDSETCQDKSTGGA